jgi:glyoxylase-like metal-dependent hydrolase (beta-lactamase superfamily II)
MRVAVLVALTGGGVACAPQAGTLDAARAALGADAVQSIEFTAAGRWYQFGQAPSPTLPWPRFDVSNYTASVNYAVPSARVQMVRIQTVEPGRARPTPVEQRVDAYVSGTSAWNMPPAGAASPAALPQPAVAEERVMEIWTTPHGFLKAAAANQASTEAAGGGSRVTFTADGHRYVGQINAQNQVERVQTWIDNPVLGDTPVEITYSGYRDFNGAPFPARIVRTQGGHPVLELDVTAVTTNPTVNLPVPPDVAKAQPPAVTATAEPLAPGVFYIRGGSHHSVAIDQQDHIVVVEAPLNEARSLAVIAKIKETIPNKPIRYIINSHHHFDHSGGLRTYVDEGATVVTHQLNRPYYEQAWAAPRTLNPDRLAKSKKPAQFETTGEKHVLTDGKRSIEIHHLVGNGHNDAFVMVYLPVEKIVIEVDAWAPTAPNVPPPPTPSPFAINLLAHIQRRQLDVQQIAALHGPRVASLGDLQAAVGATASSTR